MDARHIWSGLWPGRPLLWRGVAGGRPSAITDAIDAHVDGDTREKDDEAG
jgi:hypothetical protein